MALSVGTAAIVGTRLAVRIGNKAVVAGGLLLFGVTLWWIAAAAGGHTADWVLALQVVVGGSGHGMITAPATEAIMGAVPAAKAVVGSAVNDATRLFAATLGVAVIGSIAASLYADRLEAGMPAGVPAPAADAANGSIGGALIAARRMGEAGITAPARGLSSAATDAFLHSLAGALAVAGAVVAGALAVAGAVVAAILLPSRPQPFSIAAPAAVGAVIDAAVALDAPAVEAPAADRRRADRAVHRDVTIAARGAGVERPAWLA